MTKKIRVESIEIPMTQHCNLKCYGCDHASPLLPEKFASFEQCKADLETLGQALHADEFRFVGGEPLLHPQLLDFAKMIRDVGIVDRIVLITNGVLMHRMDPKMWDLIDGMWFSVYPGVKYKVDFDAVQKTAKEHGVKLWVKRETQFNLSLLNYPIQDPEVVDAIYKTCGMAGDCNTVHEGRFYKCSPAPLMPARSSLLQIDRLDFSNDSVQIQNNPNLHEALDKFLNSKTSLTSCSMCLGDTGLEREHRQLDRKGLEAWLAEDHKPIVDDLTQLVKHGHSDTYHFRIGDPDFGDKEKRKAEFYGRTGQDNWYDVPQVAPKQN